MDSNNQGASSGGPSSQPPPPQKKRGRPPKDPSLRLSRAPSSFLGRTKHTTQKSNTEVGFDQCMVGEALNGVVGLGSDPYVVGQVETSVVELGSDPYAVGQAVTGVVESVCGDYYLLCIRIGHSSKTLRALALKPGHAVLITPENDIAPNVPNITRNFSQFTHEDLSNRSCGRGSTKQTSGWGPAKLVDAEVHPKRKYTPRKASPSVPPVAASVPGEYQHVLCSSELQTKVKLGEEEVVHMAEPLSMIQPRFGPVIPPPPGLRPAIPPPPGFGPVIRPPRRFGPVTPPPPGFGPVKPSPPGFDQVIPPPPGFGPVMPATQTHPTHQVAPGSDKQNGNSPMNNSTPDMKLKPVTPTDVDTPGDSPSSEDGKEAVKSSSGGWCISRRQNSGNANEQFSMEPSFNFGTQHMTGLLQGTVVTEVQTAKQPAHAAVVKCHEMTPQGADQNDGETTETDELDEAIAMETDQDGAESKLRSA